MAWSSFEKSICELKYLNIHKNKTAKYQTRGDHRRETTLKKKGCEKKKQDPFSRETTALCVKYNFIQELTQFGLYPNKKPLRQNESIWGVIQHRVCFLSLVSSIYNLWIGRAKLQTILEDNVSIAQQENPAKMQKLKFDLTFESKNDGAKKQAQIITERSKLIPKVPQSSSEGIKGIE